MLRMAEGSNQDGTAKSQRFQEMYVQRHNNVRYELDMSEPNL